MTLDCPKSKKCAPTQKKSATFPNLCLLQVLRRVSVSCQNDNTKEQQGNAPVSQRDIYQIESPTKSKGTKKFKS